MIHVNDTENLVICDLAHNNVVFGIFYGTISAFTDEIYPFFQIIWKCFCRKRNRNFSHVIDIQYRFCPLKNVGLPVSPANRLFPHSRHIKALAKIQRPERMLHIRFINDNC